MLDANASSADGKLSFRLNFDRFEDAHPEIANQRFYGFKELTFSSNFDDASRMREALANEIFRDRGVAARSRRFTRTSPLLRGAPISSGTSTSTSSCAGSL